MKFGQSPISCIYKYLYVLLVDAPIFLLIYRRELSVYVILGCYIIGDITFKKIHIPEFGSDLLLMWRIFMYEKEWRLYVNEDHIVIPNIL